MTKIHLIKTIPKYFWGMGIGIFSSGIVIAWQSNWIEWNPAIAGFIILIIATCISD